MGREATIEWCRRVDEGPFSTFAYGDRPVWHTHDQFTILGAAAVLTNRVRLLTLITILPIHPAALVAKRAASVDVLSGGRLTLSVGAGPREADWRAAERPFLSRPQAQMDAKVAELRRIWSGEPFDGENQIRPEPAQSGGPPIFTSARGPKSTARAAVWADGYTGFIAPYAASPGDDAKRVFDAWEAAGRTEQPYMVTSCFFALGPDAPERLRTIASTYMSAHPVGRSVSDAFAIDSEDAVRRTIEEVEAAGFDELIFVSPRDLDELERLEAVLDSY
jgi:alkanesulfonate monooxygenase SsuD/methylene tetrahydromethanopterin reductase-like flavin-dependent oxidoreductase (luciferase family)